MDQEKETDGSFIVEEETTSFVKESKELLELVKNLNAHLQTLQTIDEGSAPVERIITIVDRYQESPELLDPYLETMVTSLMNMARENFANLKALSRICRIVYIITKVRGYKVIERFFPHEVVDFEATLALIQAQDPTDFQTWETRYVLLLWLSIIVLIPFQLSTLDSNEGKESIFDRIIALAKSYLKDAGKTRDAAAVLFARALTRPDFSSKQLSDFLEWTNEVFATSTDSFLITGVLQTLSGVFKRGKRQELLHKTSIIFKNISKLKNLTSAMHRKLFIKLMQRIGMIFLKPKLAPWRYQRGSRSLADNLKKTSGVSAPVTPTVQVEEEEEDEDIPSEIEEIIEHLLNGLRDKDTVVRWSAAKGIGRITGRLPKALGDDVVGSVLELFSIGEGDGAWHGGCLALAELARRGLLLPKRLDDVIPLILNALQYDERRGTHSIGSHVRDAACYVCWAFARAYSPEVMRDHVHKLSTGLVIVALFDREINCRRAASAAFQENVGRQGNFPRGIDIITTLDFFSLSVRNDTYAKLSVKIAQYDEYKHPIIDHLVDVKVTHWEKALRELVARSLFALTPTDPKYMHDVVLPKLLANTMSEDLFVRHGSILAVAEIALALNRCNFTIDTKRQQEIVSIVPDIEKNRGYRGKGGEIIRHAVCRLIENIAVAKIPLVRTPVTQTANPAARMPVKEKSVPFIFQDTLDENLKHPSEDIQVAAVAALKAFTRNCYSFPPKKAALDLVARYLAVVTTDPNPAARRGYTLAMGVLPQEFIVAAGAAKDVVNGMINATKVEEAAELRDAEARRNAVNGLINLCDNLQCSETGITVPLGHAVFNALLNSLCDYSIDNRGDVGSWVREVSMLALERLTYMFCRYDAQNKSDSGPYFTQEMCKTFFCLLTQQAMEKIDRTRDRAGTILERILHHNDPVIPYIPHHSELLQLLPKGKVVNWSSSSLTFPLLITLVEFDVYRSFILTGVTASIGGITQSLVLDGNNILLEYIHAQRAQNNLASIEKIANSFVDIFKANSRNDRVMIPLFKVITQLLSRNCFDFMHPSKYSFSNELLQQSRIEVSKAKDIVKIMCSIYLFCWLLMFDQPTREDAFQTLFVLLLNRYPKVRRLTADEMYIRIMTDEHIVPKASLDEILNLLSTTRWDEEITDDVRSKRDRMYELLQITKQSIVLEEASESLRMRSADEMDYKELVKEMGY